MQEKRFSAEKETVTDHLTGLMWTRNAAIADFPMTWAEALSYIEELNASLYGGYGDWHLPNRRELFSIVSHDRINPAVSAPHLFEEIFHGYYWSATSCARLPSQAWYVHLGGAKVYRGMKYASYMVWPVRESAKPGNIFRTGQKRCFDDAGREVACRGSGQDAEIQVGLPWPAPRFEEKGGAVLDRMSGLTWTRKAGNGERMLSWHEAFERIEEMNQEARHGCTDWRVPTIRELEGLVDLDAHTPALPEGHPFLEADRFYWSSNTSQYETRYAWTLYLQDGAVGVGFKGAAEFCLWPVRGREYEAHAPS
jgi:hypothetical protein